MTSEAKLRSEVARLTGELGAYERRAVEAEARARNAERQAHSLGAVLRRLLGLLRADSVAEVEARARAAAA